MVESEIGGSGGGGDGGGLERGCTMAVVSVVCGATPSFSVPCKVVDFSSLAPSGVLSLPVAAGGHQPGLPGLPFPDLPFPPCGYKLKLL